MEGNFAMVVYINGKLHALPDAMGVHYLYYYFNSAKSEWLIGTSLYEMASCLPETCSCSEFNLLEDCYQYGIWGDGTLFNEFKRIEGSSMCVVDVQKENFTLHTGIVPKSEVYSSSFENLINEMSVDIEDTMDTIGKCFGKDKIAIFMTGGLDSRMTLAGLLAADIKPHMYYGVGNSLLTNTKAPDLEIDRMYERELGLNLTVLDYKNTH